MKSIIKNLRSEDPQKQDIEIYPKCPPDVLDDEEADLLVLLVTQLELLLGSLLLLVGVHGLLRSLFLGGRDIIFVQIYIWLVNSGQKRISVTIQVLNYFSDSYNVTARTQKKTSRNALEIWFT